MFSYVRLSPAFRRRNSGAYAAPLRKTNAIEAARWGGSRAHQRSPRIGKRRTIQKKAGVNIPQVNQSASEFGTTLSQSAGRPDKARHAAFWAADRSPSTVHVRRPSSQSCFVSARVIGTGTYVWRPALPPWRHDLVVRGSDSANPRRASRRNNPFSNSVI